MTVYPALGTKLSVDKTGGSSSYTDIGQVLSIDGPSSEVGQAKTTNLASTWQEWRPTLPDGGTVGFDVQYDPTDTGTHSFLKTIAATPAKYHWKVTYPTTPETTDSFRAFLTKLGRSASGAEENLEASCELKVDGPIT